MFDRLNEKFKKNDSVSVIIYSQTVCAYAQR